MRRTKRRTLPVTLTTRCEQFTFRCILCNERHPIELSCVPFLSRNPFQFPPNYSHFLNHSMVPKRAPIIYRPKPFGYLPLPECTGKKSTNQQVHIFKPTRTAFQRAWAAKPTDRSGKGNKSRKLPQKISNLHSSRESYPFQRAFVAEPRASNITTNHPKNATTTTTIMGFFQLAQTDGRKKKKASLQSTRLSVWPFWCRYVRSTCVLSALGTKRPQSASFSLYTSLCFPFQATTLPIGY